MTIAEDMDTSPENTLLQKTEVLPRAPRECKRANMDGRVDMARRMNPRGETLARMAGTDDKCKGKGKGKSFTGECCGCGMFGRHVDECRVRIRYVIEVDYTSNENEEGTHCDANMTRPDRTIMTHSVLKLSLKR